MIAALGTRLAPGGAILAVLHTRGSTCSLDEAVIRAGGRTLLATPVEARTLADASPLARVAAAR